MSLGGHVEVALDAAAECARVPFEGPISGRWFESSRPDYSKREARVSPGLSIQY